MQYKASFTFWIGFFYMLHPLFLKKLCKIDFFQNKKTGKGTLIMQDILDKVMYAQYLKKIFYDRYPS